MNLIFKPSRRKRFLYLFLLLLILQSSLIMAQGFNHTWLLSYAFSPTTDKARLDFNSFSQNLIYEQRKIPFQNITQGNISDVNGNYLMSSNGLWIANAANDTMMNGSGLNPNSFTSSWPNGLPLPNGNMFLPFPEDTTKYILFHQTGNDNANLSSTVLYYSMIDITLDNGFGEVTEKNDTVVQDTLGWGITACKHANGRDWWIIAVSDSMDYVYKILLTPIGIQSVSTQNLPNMQPYSRFSGQPVFSPDGSKFAFPSTYEISNNYWYHDVRLFSFDRCSGMFTNPLVVDLTDSMPGFGLAFSSNSKYLYANSLLQIFQLNTDTTNIQASVEVVAVNDNFSSPFPPFYTTFWMMYLAANSQIYITSGASVQAIHFMNYPDSSGTACDVQQHALQLTCWNKGSVPNHPNYYLGCDSTSGCPCLTPNGIDELINHDFKFSISPNPNDGHFRIIYLLPQNKSGTLEIFDINGKRVYAQPLPQWSTLQQISLPDLANGLYSCVITSGNNRAGKKIAIIKE